jgi:DNA-binding transcriptional ArsR family regulator
MKKSAALAALAALSQETRLDLFRTLVQRGPDGLAAGDLGARLCIALPTLSFHLATLRRANLIRARRAGRSIIYCADYRTMDALLAYLTEKCCAGASPAVVATRTTSGRKPAAA